jgi:hypothetical protein
MRNLAKFALAGALLSSAGIFPAGVSAAPFSPSPIATQGDTEIVSVAMTRRQRMMMHRRAMMKRHGARSNVNRVTTRSTGAVKDMSTSDTGAVGNTRAPLSQRGSVSPGKDMSSTDTAAPGNTRAPTSARGPRTPAKDMSTSDTPK